MFLALENQAIQGILFSSGFCICFVFVFFILQATRLEECFKKGKMWQIKMAYFIISFVFAFLITYGFSYLCSLFLQ